MVEPNKWFELAVSYDGSKGVADIYVDSTRVKEEISDPMNLSQDWGMFAGIYLHNCTITHKCTINHDR